MLIKFMVGIISQHIHIPNHYVVHLIQYSYSNYISVKLVGGGGAAHKKGKSSSVWKTKEFQPPFYQMKSHLKNSLMLSVKIYHLPQASGTHVFHENKI